MATTSESSATDSESLALLMSMGFDQDLSSAALKVSSGDLESAIGYLTDEAAQAVLRAEALRLAGAATVDGTSSSATHSAFSPMVVASLSQYSFDGGQSACTCMALEIAQGLLASDEPAAALSPAFLDGALRRGVDIYTSILTSSTEHMSAEDAWTQFSNLKLQGEVVQGVLNRDPSHPQGLMALLRQCCPPASSHDESHGNDWVCVVLTKTPETVLLCLSRRDGYTLVDSHPRPNIWPDAIHAYAKHHDTLEELVASVNLIFPIVDLGSDVPELMTVMYNSFDLYTFEQKSTGDAGDSNGTNAP